MFPNVFRKLKILPYKHKLNILIWIGVYKRTGYF